MLAEVIVQLRQGIGEEHGVPVAMIVLVPPGALPKTSSGKVRRHAAAIAAREHSVVALGRWEPSTQVSSSQHVTPTAVLA